MKKRTKAAALLTAAAMIIGLLSGCAMSAYEISIDPDGSVEMCYGEYLSEKFFETKNTTPEEYYAVQLAEGKNLVAMYDQDNTYWGIEPDPLQYDSIPEFVAAANGMDGVRAKAEGDRTNSSLTIWFDIDTKDDVAVRYGGNEASSDLIDYAVTYISVIFPGKCLTADYPLYGRGERFANDKGYSIYAKYGEKAYTVMVCGRLSEDTPLYALESVSARVDKPEPGQTYEDVDIAVKGVCGNVEVDMMKECEPQVFWYSSENGSDDQNDWNAMTSDDVFESGKYYAVEFSLFNDHCLYTPTKETVVLVNGEENDTTFGQTYRDGDLFLNCQFYLEPNFHYTRPTPELTSPVRPSDKQVVVLKNASLTVDEPKAGLNVYEIEWRVSDGDLDALDREKAEIEWFRFDDEWVSIDEYERFETGKLYGFDLKIPVKENVELSGDLQLFINGEKQSAGYSVFGELNGSPAAVFSWDFTIPAAEEGPGLPPALEGKTVPFTDVTMDDYYFDAVVWAFNADPQITDGTSATTFSPDKTCTRGQVVTFLYRALKYPVIYSGDNPFKDVNSFNYFYQPVLWAYSNPSQVTDGTSPTTFSPDKPCTNAQILTFIWRAMGRPNDKGAEKTPEYWKDAYNWAVSKDMLEGTGVSEKNINEPCPRKNVVQFLYMYNVMMNAN